MPREKHFFFFQLAWAFRFSFSIPLLFPGCQTQQLKDEMHELWRILWILIGAATPRQHRPEPNQLASCWSRRLRDSDRPNATGFR